MSLVSVVMPVYNGEKFLRDAFDSILRQTFADFQFIVVDDGSGDNTASIVQSYNDERIHFLQNPANLGIVDTLNKGLAHAQGRYICRMDADDIAEPNRIEIQVNYLEENPRVAMVGSNTRVIDFEGVITEEEHYPQTSDDIRRTIFVHNPFAHSTVMVRRAVLDEIGYYDKRFKHNEDYDLWLRIAAKYDVANLPDLLIKRRVHAESITGAKETELTGFRIRTLNHAILYYYKNPLRMVYVIRPALAYVFRRMRDAVTI